MRAIARYFGFGVEDEITPLRLMRADMLRGSARVLVVAAIATAATIAFLDWDPARVAVGTAIGIAVFAPAGWAFTVRKRMPLGPLPAAPPDASWANEHERPTLRSIVSAALVLIPAAVFVVWITREEGELFAAIFFPGQLIGSTLADLLGAWRVGGWEEQHGRLVAYRYDGGEIQRFAVDPPAQG